MATTPIAKTPISAVTHADWREHWFENEEAIYLNLAAQSPMPKVSFRAVQASLEWKKFPQRIPDTAFFDAPDRIRQTPIRGDGLIVGQMAMNPLVFQ